MKRTPAQFLLDVWKYQAQPGCYFFISVKPASSSSGWRDIPLKAPVSRVAINRVLKKYPDTRYHVYFCPLPFRGPKRDRTWVLGSRLLWADLDEANPQKFDIVPQIAWESSPGRFASLWILNEFHTPLEIEPVNKAITYQVDADHGGWDLTQVLRIPGLRNQKYDEQPKAQLLWFTDNLYDISDIPEQVVTLDPKAVLTKYKKKLPKATLMLLTSKRATQGKRSDVIWKLENALSEAGLSPDECYTLIKGSVWNKFRGRNDEERQLRREIDKVADRRPALIDERETVMPKKKKKRKGPVTRLSDVEPEKVSWLWYPYIPRGKLTIIEGDPGLGKSWISMALAAHISQRKKFPGAPRPVGGSVMLFSAEDGLGDTIRPRLDKVGANVRKVFAYEDPVIFDEVGIVEVEEAIAYYRPAMVIIDPLVAYMGGGVDLNKANETREVMTRLAIVAEDYKCAMVCIRHLRKGSADKSIYRGLGSIDLTAAARSVLMVGQDPNEAETRLIVHIKSNLASVGKTLRYQLQAGRDNPFRWDGTSDLGAEDLNTGKTGSPVRSENAMASEFLDEKLKGTPVKFNTLVREAESQGISRKALLIAKKEKDIKRIKGDDGVYWTNN